METHGNQILTTVQCNRHELLEIQHWQEQEIDQVRLFTLLNLNYKYFVKLI